MLNCWLWQQNRHVLIKYSVVGRSIFCYWSNGQLVLVPCDMDHTSNYKHVLVFHFPTIQSCNTKHCIVGKMTGMGSSVTERSSHLFCKGLLCGLFPYTCGSGSHLSIFWLIHLIERQQVIVELCFKWTCFISLHVIAFTVVALMTWAATWQNQQSDCAPAKTQISLGSHPVWSESLLCAQWVAKDPSFLHADSQDWSDWADAQADLSLRWAHTHFVGFVML